MDDSPIVEFITNQPGMAERLLAEHVDDGSGHCPACPLGGQKGYQRWPCNLHHYATQASKVGRLRDQNRQRPP